MPVKAFSASTSEAYRNGIAEVRLTKHYAELIYQAMEKTKTGPAEALAWLLDIASTEMGSGEWDGSSASLRAPEGLRVTSTNLEQLAKFKKGDLVAVGQGVHTLPFVVAGVVVEGGHLQTRIHLTVGTMNRMAEHNVVTTGDMTYMTDKLYLL